MAQATRRKKRATPRRQAFIGEDFLLGTRQARQLFHDYAEDLPIIDYHCHLDPKSIAEDRRFLTITEPWLEGDHYKWRAMRTCGVDERFITGDASPWEKFEKWAETVPHTLRNPLYHWTHLELRQPFGITNRLLGPDTARPIYDDCNRILAKPGFTTRGILKRMKVEVVCTTDDPADSLEHHRAMASDPSMTTAVYPAFRPDKAMAVDDPAAYNAYLGRLPQRRGPRSNRTMHFSMRCKASCMVSRAGMPAVRPRPRSSGRRRPYGGRSRSAVCDRPRKKAPRSRRRAQTEISDPAWNSPSWMQKAGGCNNTISARSATTIARMMRTLGPDTGFDSIGDWPARPFACAIPGPARRDKPARTDDRVQYKPCRDNEMMATMIGNFQDGSVAGKVQFGAAWWFLDQREGMLRQLEALSAMGLLGQFIGMLTDSRSFLSYPRHEYFRRLLCGLLGDDMANGLLPSDLTLVGALVQDVGDHNARRTFPFPCDAKVRQHRFFITSQRTSPMIPLPPSILPAPRQ